MLKEETDRQTWKEETDKYRRKRQTDINMEGKDKQTDNGRKRQIDMEGTD